MRIQIFTQRLWPRSWGLLAVVFAALTVCPLARADKALILGPTVVGGAGSREALAAVAAGLTVDVVSNVTWAAETAPDFASYRVIILGDPSCGGIDPAAVANNTVWGPVINGNIIIIGTDPVFHAGGHPGAGTLINNGVAFAGAQAGKTGLYADLSCAYGGSSPGTPVPLLSPFGAFTVQGVPCVSAAHIVASHPALSGLTDAGLSNWSCSVHEAFDTWPVSNFTVLVIALGIGGTFHAGDGTVGFPYILASGKGIVITGSCGHHTVHGHLVTTPPPHLAVSGIHHGQHGHLVTPGAECPPHAPGHSPGLMPETDGEGLFSTSGAAAQETVAETVPPTFLIGVNEDGTLNGDPAVLNVPDRKFVPTKRGSVLQLFGSAEGLFLDQADQQAAAGFTPPASGSPMFYTSTLPEVRIGGVAAQVVFSGLAPGLRGVWQLNVLIPKDAPAGKAPVTISYDGDELRSVTLAIE